MDYMDEKYLMLCTVKIRNFKKKNNSLFNFSCPICQDSKINKRKARGYIFSDKGKVTFYCHNCNLTYSFSNFLKEVMPELYMAYQLEKFSKKEPKEVYKKDLYMDP